jgi:hypothetical protein
MNLFNIVLLTHFSAFLGGLSTLVVIFPKKDAPRSKTGLIMGIIILLTGIMLVRLEYPFINYYKIIPKMAIFLTILIINIIYRNKGYTTPIYYTLLVLSLVAALLGASRA